MKLCNHLLNNVFNVLFKKLIKPYKERKKINNQKAKMKEEYKKTIKIINE